MRGQMRPNKTRQKEKWRRGEETKGVGRRD